METYIHHSQGENFTDLTEPCLQHNLLLMVSMPNPCERDHIVKTTTYYHRIKMTPSSFLSPIISDKSRR